jgi:hydroxylaminobenzene mutase
MSDPRAARLVFHGLVQFLLGLVLGALVATMANPRMGLASHLEGVMNGTFLLALGAAWGHVRLSERAAKAAVGLLLYGSYANLIATAISAWTGAGASMMPLAGAGHAGPAWAEAVVPALLGSLSLAMLAGVSLTLWGASRPR